MARTVADDYIIIYQARAERRYGTDRGDSYSVCRNYVGRHEGSTGEVCPRF